MCARRTPSCNPVGSTSVGCDGKRFDLKMYHVMSVKQSLREDLAEHSYQFSCRAADSPTMSFSQVPMQFEPLELHVVEALGQQDVSEYFQQPAKAITDGFKHSEKKLHLSRDQVSMRSCQGSMLHPYRYPQGLSLSLSQMCMEDQPGRRLALLYAVTFRICIQMNSRLPKPPATLPLGWHCLLPPMWDGQSSAGISPQPSLCSVVWK